MVGARSTFLQSLYSVSQNKGDTVLCARAFILCSISQSLLAYAISLPFVPRAVSRRPPGQHKSARSEGASKSSRARGQIRDEGIHA